MDREFEFSNNDNDLDGINLLKFAELDPRLVLANHDPTDSTPLDLHIEVTVTNILEEKLAE